MIWIRNLKNKADLEAFLSLVNEKMKKKVFYQKSKKKTW